jgi:hypothetical protein
MSAANLFGAPDMALVRAEHRLEEALAQRRVAPDSDKEGPIYKAADAAVWNEIGVIDKTAPEGLAGIAVKLRVLLSEPCGLELESGEYGRTSLEQILALVEHDQAAFERTVAAHQQWSVERRITAEQRLKREQEFLALGFRKRLARALAAEDYDIPRLLAAERRELTRLPDVGKQGLDEIDAYRASRH